MAHPFFEMAIIYEKLFISWSLLQQSYYLSFLVGYDSLHMNLAGKFSYQKENQRTLSFNVDINKLPQYKTVFAGSSSK